MAVAGVGVGLCRGKREGRVAREGRGQGEGVGAG